MTLPQTTIDAINAEADKYGFVVPYDGSNKFYNDDKVKGYKSGATEWAGKAQGLVDTLKWIQMHCPIEPIVDDAISAALAKYKEVTP